MIVGEHVMIFRDDDISYLTNLEEFKRIHEIFNRYKLTHTIAVIAKNIELAPHLIKYINSQKNISVQVHCWDHFDLTTLDTILHDQIGLAVKSITKHFSRPKFLFPPWNKSDARVMDAAAYHGIECKPVKLSLPQYIRVKGHVAEDVVNFHYWDYEDVMHLDTALQIYKNRNIE